MKNRIQELIQEIMRLPKRKNQIIRVSIFPKLKEINNITWKEESLYSINDDATIYLHLPLNGQYFKIISQIKSENQNLSTHIYFGNKNSTESTKKDFVCIGKANGKLNFVYLNTKKGVNEFKLRPIDSSGKFDIEYFEIIKISFLEYYLKTGKYKKVFKLLKLVTKKPILIIKFIIDTINNGLGYSIQKVKNYLNRLNN